MSRLHDAGTPLWILSLLLLLMSSSAVALDPSRHLTQQSHYAWRVQDGVFESAPLKMAQTRDGYLWIGSAAGLLRFDGVKYTRWTEIYNQELPDSWISALLGDRDGSLWIGSSTGLAHLKDGQLSVFKSTNGAVRAIVQDPSGAIWVSRTNVHDGQGPLCRALTDTLHCYDQKDGIRFDYGRSLALGPDGSLWMGSDALLRWRPGSSTEYFGESLKSRHGLDGVHSIAIGNEGELWASVSGTGKGLGLQHFIDDKWTDFFVPGMDGTRLSISALFVDRDDALWVGTANDGLYRVHGGIAEHFQASDGLSSNSIQGFFQDNEGNVWVETHGGLDRFRNFQIATFGAHEGLSSESAHSVLAAHDGTIWIGNNGSLAALRNGTITSIRESNGLPGREVTSLLEDHNVY